ncbi:MAG: family 10 glycosylhydrolase, partial [Oscillospiraceae bacterium]|nr:family 10 glycosylhydrolase [Oscillospiraceae bacterium]
ISAMVRELYSGIKSVNSTVLFGVSPQGNVNNNYSSQYADVRKWCSQNGYLDYIVPQIYYGFKNTSQPYATNLQSWCDMVTASGVKLVAGLAAYKIGTSESTGEWLNDKRILARQVETFKAQPKYGGVAFFRYESIFAPASGVAAQMEQEKAELAAVLK